MGMMVFPTIERGELKSKPKNEKKPSGRPSAVSFACAVPCAAGVGIR